MFIIRVLPRSGKATGMSSAHQASGHARTAARHGRQRYGAITFECTARVVMLGLLFITHTNSF